MVYVGLGSLGFFPPERVSKIFEAIGEAITQVRLELGMCEWVGGWRVGGRGNDAGMLLGWGQVILWGLVFWHLWVSM